MKAQLPSRAYPNQFSHGNNSAGACLRALVWQHSPGLGCLTLLKSRDSAFLSVCAVSFVQAQPVQPMQPLQPVQPVQAAQPAPAPHLQEHQPKPAREVRRVLGGWDSTVRAVLGPCMSRNIHRSFADTIKLAVFAGPTCVCHWAVFVFLREASCDFALFVKDVGCVALGWLSRKD